MTEKWLEADEIERICKDPNMATPDQFKGMSNEDREAYILAMLFNIAKQQNYTNLLLKKIANQCLHI